jgi:hypothetical protein
MSPAGEIIQPTGGSQPSGGSGDSGGGSSSGGGGTPTPPRPSDKEIGGIFDPLFGALGQAESVLRGQFPETQRLIGDQAATAREQLGAAKESALGQLGEQRTGAQTRSEDAIAAARRLFNELGMANRQRFGGASSAGLAASELQGREFQRNRGDIDRNLGVAMREIDQAQANTEKEYNLGLQEVENRKNVALQQAQNEFNQRLLDIQSERGRLEGEKAAARLQALTDFRNMTYQINLQEAQFKQQLDAQRQSNLQQLSATRETIGQQVGAGQAAQQQFGAATTTNPNSQFGVGQTATSGVQAPTGQISDDEQQTGILGNVFDFGRRTAAQAIPGLGVLGF